MKTIALDIETIADAAACFPPWPLHQILCVFLLTHERTGWDDHHFTIETFSRAGNGERAILAEAEQRLERCDTIVTYNGRGFDVPVLLARAAIADEYVPSIARAHAHRAFVRGVRPLTGRALPSAVIPGSGGAPRWDDGIPQVSLGPAETWSGRNVLGLFGRTRRCRDDRGCARLTGPAAFCVESTHKDGRGQNSGGRLLAISHVASAADALASALFPLS